MSAPSQDDFKVFATAYSEAHFGKNGLVNPLIKLLMTRFIEIIGYSCHKVMNGEMTPEDNDEILLTLIKAYFEHGCDKNRIRNMLNNVKLVGSHDTQKIDDYIEGYVPTFHELILQCFINENISVDNIPPSIYSS